MRAHRDAGIDPSLIEVRGVGSRDLAALKRGLRKPTLKISHIPPSDAPINFIQHTTTLNSLSIQVLWYKGLFASATDIISLLYKGMRIDKLTVECSIEDFVKATVELVGQDVAVGTGKISGATYADYAGAVAHTESFVQRGAADGSNLAAVERDRLEIQHRKQPKTNASHTHYDSLSIEVFATPPSRVKRRNNLRV
jgi:hypothetical protein